MSDISYIPTQALVQELRKRRGVQPYRVPPNTPFEILVDAEEVETPYCEGPAFILLVGDDA